LKHLFLIYILIIINSCFCVSQNAINYDSTNFEIRIPSESEIESYKFNPDFKYDREVNKPVTIWDRILFWLLQRFYDLFSNTGAAPFIRYIIVGLLFILILVKILNTDFQALFIKSKKQLNLDYSILDEDINKINLDEMIEKSIKEQDYRLATRYLFLKTLKILTTNNFIEWKINKTNSDFVVEIKETKFYEDFKKLSLTFEHIWYGNFDLTNENFVLLKSKFETFNKSLNQQN